MLKQIAFLLLKDEKSSDVVDVPREIPIPSIITSLAKI